MAVRVKHDFKVCPGCGQKYDILSGQENTDWIHFHRRYWHVICYNEYLYEQEKNGGYDAYLSKIYKLVAEYDTKNKLNHQLIKNQYAKYNEGGYKPQDIYNALVYFYEYKSHDVSKSHGIGIVPFIIDEAKKYYELKTEQRKEFNKTYTAAQAAETNIITINTPDKNTGKKYTQLDWSFESDND